MGWLTVRNQARTNAGQLEIDLKDRATNQIWRFEMQSWQDLRETIGNAYRAFFEKIRYCTPINDSNRARWPIHPIWLTVQQRVESGLLGYASVDHFASRHGRSVERRFGAGPRE